MIKVTKIGEKISVQFPYHEEVKDKIKQFGRVGWDAAQKTWLVDASFEKEVRQVLTEAFGTDGDTQVDTVTVMITFKEDAYGDRAPVSLAGKVFSSARGRDSGAVVGEDVALLEGKIGSGGSMKNWNSWVREGSKFKVINVYPSRLSEFDLGKVSIEVLSEEKAPEVEQSETPKSVLPDYYSDEDLIAELERRGFTVKKTAIVDKMPDSGVF